MEKRIDFKKELAFKTNVSEITSIALENTLKTQENMVEGDLIINGTYKITETSTKVDAFEFVIPLNIEIDDKYSTEQIQIDINDFYYEVINNSVLEVNVEILLENIIEKQNRQEKVIEEPISIKPSIENNKQKEENKIEEKERCIEEETEQKEINIFENITKEQEEYSTYHIYIVREGDTLETILNKYNITKEKMSEYNDIAELKIGDKIIIPEQKNA
jgi:hypothetical protein